MVDSCVVDAVVGFQVVDSIVVLSSGMGSVLGEVLWVVVGIAAVVLAEVMAYVKSGKYSMGYFISTSK